MMRMMIAFAHLLPLLPPKLVVKFVLHHEKKKKKKKKFKVAIEGEEVWILWPHFKKLFLASK